MSRANRNEKENEKPEQKKENRVLEKWHARYEEARAAYADQLEKFRIEEQEYDGSDRILAKPGRKKAANASAARNVVYELIETEVETAVPRPKVKALHEEDEPLSRLIEAMLMDLVQKLPMEAVNDANERETYMHGGAFIHVDWDALGGLHKTLGCVSVHDLASCQVIPQAGAEWLEEADWYFIVQPMTRQRIWREYRQSVSEEQHTEPGEEARSGEQAENGGRLSVITAFYKNENGGIGKMTWCGNTVLENAEQYLQRQKRVCRKCGAEMPESVCPECGAEEWKLCAAEEIALPEGLQIPAEAANGWKSAESAAWQPGAKRLPKTVKAYRMKHYPTVMRKNICAKGRFMGVSDIETVLPLQEAMKKLDTKILEKLLKGGSYVTLPQGVGVETTDRELKIIRLKTPAEKALIDVIPVQPNISHDMAMRASYYQDMKSCLGITDAYQGKQDQTATSGTAKQISVNQAAGRLESKRVMKRQMWAQLYRVMFEMWLLFSDDAACVRQETQSGSAYAELCKWDFLRRDASGNFYWNDEFLFDVEMGGVSNADRAAMQERIRSDFQAGMYGDTKLVESRIRLWKMLVKYGAPGAESMLEMAMEEKRQQDAAESGVMENDLPQMQKSFADRSQPGGGDGGWSP